MASPRDSDRNARPEPVRLAHVLGYAGHATRRSGVTGVERVVESLLEGLGPEFEQGIVYPEPGLLLERYRATAAWVTIGEPRRHLDPAFVRMLAGAVRAHRLDVLVSHGTRYDFHAAIAARRTGVAHVVSRAVAFADETFPPLRRLLAARADAWTLGGASAIVAVSEASKHRMVDTQGLDPSRIEVIPNGVAVPPIAPEARAAARRALGAGESDFVIGGAGQLIERKAFHLTILAAARLAPEAGERPLVAIAGDGPERDRLQALAATHGVRLALPGFLENPHPTLAAFDVLVLPSRAEGMPLVLLEAMALGVPCIATPAAGNVEVIEDGVAGILVRFDDVADLAAALQHLRGDAAARARMGAAAAARIGAQFSRAAMHARFRALLRRVARR